jgi:YD repeat-containing protein
MANNILIQGEKALGASKAFIDAGELMGQGLADSASFSREPSTTRQNQEYQNSVNKYMGQLKSDIDFTSFSPSETSTMRNFLIGERSKYADAAKKIAKLDDASSPEYMQLVDQMNSVNNSFGNLADQIKSYKKSKADYAKDQVDGALSNGVDPNVNRTAMLMYGFYDKDKDKKSDAAYDAPFTILPGGNIGFNIDNQTVPFNDAPSPFYKDYALANNILKNNESIYKSGQLPTKTENDMYRVQLQQSLQNPNSLKSLVYDFDGELGMRDIGNIWDANKGADGEIDIIRDKVINRLIQARTEVAAQGAAEKAAKKAAAEAQAAAKRQSRSSSGSSAPASGGAGRTAIVKGADGKSYETTYDASGKVIGTKVVVEVVKNWAPKK